jgi:hypothetical protein
MSKPLWRSTYLRRPKQLILVYVEALTEADAVRKTRMQVAKKYSGLNLQFKDGPVLANHKGTN